MFILIGADYNPVSNPNGFSFGSSSGNMLCTSVSIVPDSDYEMDEENLFADLSRPQNSRVTLSPPQTEVVIADNDSKFKLNGKKKSLLWILLSQLLLLGLIRPLTM